MNILVTGGKGYIGSELVKTLKDEGHEVSVYDFKDEPLNDVCDRDRTYTAISKVDVVYHLASLCIVGDSLKQPFKYWDNIIVGAKNVLEACRLYNKRMIFTSTQLAGDSFRCSCCGRLNSPYAEAKREAEKIVETLSDTLVVRLTNIYDLEEKDPNQSRLFPRLGKMARETGVVKIFPPEDTPVILVPLSECCRKLASYITSPKGMIQMEGEHLTIRDVADRVAAKYGAIVEITERNLNF